MGNHWRFKQEIWGSLISFIVVTHQHLSGQRVMPVSHHLHYPNDEHWSWGKSADPHMNENEKERWSKEHVRFLNEIWDGLQQCHDRKYRHNWLKSSVQMRMLALHLLNVCTDRSFRQNCWDGNWKHSQILGLCCKCKFVLLC